MHSNFSALRGLLEGGADVLAVSSSGDSLLHCAMRNATGPRLEAMLRVLLLKDLTVRHLGLRPLWFQSN